MKKTLILFSCILAFFQAEVFGKGGGFSGGARISSGARISTRSISVRSGSINASKIGTGGSRGIRNFGKSSSPKSISKHIGKPFAKSRQVSTSAKARRSASYTYTKPVTFHNPYFTYFLMSHYARYDSTRVDTNAFPGFGKGKSGGAGASALFADSLKKHGAKSTLEISDLVPINFLSDYAGIIPDKDEPRINYLIRNYKKTTGVEIAILTIPTLGDEIDLEEYTQVLFDKWGVGERGVNNGILIVISSEDEILRIQPGYGMEELLPDAICRRIEDNIMVPACEKAQWKVAVVGALVDITKTLGNKPLEMMKKELAKRQVEEHQKMMDTLFTGLIIIVAIVLIIITGLFIQRWRDR